MKLQIHDLGPKHGFKSTKNNKLSKIKQNKLVNNGNDDLIDYQGKQQENKYNQASDTIISNLSGNMSATHSYQTRSSNNGASPSIVWNTRLLEEPSIDVKKNLFLQLENCPSAVHNLDFSTLFNQKPDNYNNLKWKDMTPFCEKESSIPFPLRPSSTVVQVMNLLTTDADQEDSEDASQHTVIDSLDIPSNTVTTTQMELNSSITGTSDRQLDYTIGNSTSSNSYIDTGTLTSTSIPLANHKKKKEKKKKNGNNNDNINSYYDGSSRGCSNSSFGNDNNNNCRQKTNNTDIPLNNVIVDLSKDNTDSGKPSFAICGIDFPPASPDVSKTIMYDLWRLMYIEVGIISFSSQHHSLPWNTLVTSDVLQRINQYKPDKPYFRMTHQDPFTQDYILIPCADKSHFSLIAIVQPFNHIKRLVNKGKLIQNVDDNTDITLSKKDNNNSIILHLDSLFNYDSPDKSIHDAEYLFAKAGEFLNLLWDQYGYRQRFYSSLPGLVEYPFTMDGYKISSKVMKVPQQTNVIDCGPHTLRNASVIMMMNPIQLHQVVKQNATLSHNVDGSLSNPRTYVDELVQNKYTEFLNRSTNRNQHLLSNERNSHSSNKHMYKDIWDFDVRNISMGEDDISNRTNAISNNSLVHTTTMHDRPLPLLPTDLNKFQCHLCKKQTTGLHYFTTHFKSCAFKKEGMSKSEIADWITVYRQQWSSTSSTTSCSNTNSCIAISRLDDFDRLFEDSMPPSTADVLTLKVHDKLLEMRKLITSFATKEHESELPGVVHIPLSHAIDSIRLNRDVQIEWDVDKVTPTIVNMFTLSPTISEITYEGIVDNTISESDEALLVEGVDNMQRRLDYFQQYPVSSVPLLYDYLERISAPYSSTFQGKEMGLYKSLLLQCMSDCVQAWTRFSERSCIVESAENKKTSFATRASDLNYIQQTSIIAIFVLPALFHKLQTTAPTRKCFFKNESLSDKSTRTKLIKFLVQLCEDLYNNYAVLYSEFQDYEFSMGEIILHICVRNILFIYPDYDPTNKPIQTSNRKPTPTQIQRAINSGKLSNGMQLLRKMGATNSHNDTKSIDINNFDGLKSKYPEPPDCAHLYPPSVDDAHVSSLHLPDSRFIYEWNRFDVDVKQSSIYKQCCQRFRSSTGITSSKTDHSKNEDTSVYGSTENRITLTSEDVLSAIQKLKPDSATGVSSDTFSLWKYICGTDEGKVEEILVPFINQFLTGCISPGVMPLFLASRVIPIPKTNIDGSHGIRPLGIGCSLYRIINKAVALKINTKVGERLLHHQVTNSAITSDPNHKKIHIDAQGHTGLQTCVGISDSCPTIGTILQGYVDSKSLHTNSSSTRFQIKSLDASNAFNSMSLTAIYHGLQIYCPELIPWFLISYGLPTQLILSNGTLLGSQETGVKQGDPLAMLLFAIGLQTSLNDIQKVVYEEAINTISKDPSNNGNENILPPLTIAYADDITIVAPITNWDDDDNGLAKKVSTILYKNCGLKLNLSKTQTLDISAIHANPHNPKLGINVVGIPIGSAGYREEFAKTTLASMRDDLDLIRRYASVIPTQHLFALLKYCIVPRSGFLQRTIDPIEKRDNNTGRLLPDTYKCPIESSLTDLDDYVSETLFHLMEDTSLSELMLSKAPILDSTANTTVTASSTTVPIPLLAIDVLKVIRDIPIRYGGLGLYDSSGIRRQLSVLTKRDTVYRFASKYIPRLCELQLFELNWNSYPIPIVKDLLPSNLYNVEDVSLSNGDWYKLYFDGGARGNSAGAAGSGWVIYDHQDIIIKKGSQFLGFKDITNNMAEYTAFIRGIEEALELNITHLHIYGDSDLIVRQINQVCDVSSILAPYNLKARRLLQQFEGYTIRHVCREENQLADHLANVAMDTQTNAMNIPIVPHIDDINYGSLVLDEHGHIATSKVYSPIPPLHDNGKFSRSAKDCKAHIQQSKEHLARIKQSQLVKMFLQYGLQQFATLFTSMACKEAGVWLQWYGSNYCRFGYENQSLKNFGHLLRVRCCLPMSSCYDLSDKGHFNRICPCFKTNPATYSQDVFHILGCPANSIIRTGRHNQIIALLVSLMRQQAKLSETDGNRRNLRIDSKSISTEDAYGKSSANGYHNKSDICLTVFNKKHNSSERLTLDVMIVNPTSKKYLSLQPPVPPQNFASELGRKHKLAKYADAAGIKEKDLPKTVIPLIWETTGRMHPQTKQFLDTLFQDTYTGSSLRRRLYTSVSFIIQRHNANLLRRDIDDDSRFIKF